MSESAVAAAPLHQPASAPDKKSLLRRLLHFVPPYTKYAILSPILMIIEVMTDVYIPLLMRDIINVGIAQKDVSLVVTLGLKMLLSAVIGLFAGATSSRMGATAGFGFGANLRKAMYAKVQTFSFANLDRFSVPSLITRLTNDCNNLSQSGMMAVRMGFRAPFMLIFAFVMAFSVNRELAAILGLAIPVMGVLVFLIMKSAGPRFSQFQRRIDDLNAIVQENLTAIRIVKSFVRQPFEKQRFKKANDELRQAGLYAITLVIWMGPIMTLVMSVCMIAIIWFGGVGITTGRMQAGDIMSFLTYVTQILISLMMLSMLFLQFTRAKASADRVLEVIEADVDLTSPPDGLKTMKDGEVVFEHVSFRYPGNPGDSLSDINLRIQSGSTVGVIGSTGSAKTSLVQLIPRLYDVSAGAVKIGGVDVRKYDLRFLRDEVSVVLQKNTLFSGTLRENMQWGNPEASDQEIIRVLKLAQAWEFIKDLDGGLDAPVEQGGSNFSGGQRQRLCIARSLLKNPKVLILDDSTSAVDMATDAKLRYAFTHELPDLTIIIIAQRIASIADADEVIVLDDGRIDGVGRPEELLRSSQIYREVYESQQKGVIGE